MIYKQKNKKLTAIARKIEMVIFDFDGVFTDNRVLVSEEGREFVFCSRGDGYGIKLLKDAGVKILVISTEENPVVSSRCRKLKIDCIQACEDKIKILRQEAKKHNIELDKIAYLGNDVNDLACLKAVGLPSCVSDAHKDISGHCIYKTKTKGGFGAVREFCDFIIGAKK